MAAGAAQPGAAPSYLTAAELVERWGGKVAPQTLRHWRSRTRGPGFVKLGGKVLYRLDVVEAYEAGREAVKGAHKWQVP